MKRLLITLSVAAGLVALNLPAQAASVPVTKILLIMEENHTYADASANMPYLMGLARCPMPRGC